MGKRKAPWRSRTFDDYLASQPLYQLSYDPISGNNHLLVPFPSDRSIKDLEGLPVNGCILGSKVRSSVRNVQQNRPFFRRPSRIMDSRCWMHTRAGFPLRLIVRLCFRCRWLRDLPRGCYTRLTAGQATDLQPKLARSSGKL